MMMMMMMVTTMMMIDDSLAEFDEKARYVIEFIQQNNENGDTNDANSPSELPNLITPSISIQYLQ